MNRGKRIRLDTSGGDDGGDDDGFDPTEFYKKQQKEMLLKASLHVRASKLEIQEAQKEADQAPRYHSIPSTTTNSAVPEGGRRSRSAANAAKAAMSMMNETDMDEVVFGNRRKDPATPAAVIIPTARTPSSRARGRGRPRPRISSTSPEEILRVRKKGSKGRPVTEITEDESSLYYIIRNTKASLQQVVDDWIDNYKEEKDKALLSLMQFFISASGCRGTITPLMQSSMEHTDIIRCMTEEFEEESGEYPLVTAGQFWKKFRGNFCEFIQLLVKQCQYSIIYDQHLMDNIISLLTQLSDSQVRAFRHTATLAAMKLMTALVDIALTVSINMENTQRQYDAEQQKTRDKRATNRLETLMTRRKELEENTEEIKNMLTYMFKSVFVHRYRDTLPEIRSICMFEIGQWMKKYHQQFLDDTYLKYIGWTIHDKVGDVRLKCLQTLQPLYSSEELKGKLELFTSKFKDRIVSMTLDKEFDVAVEAVRLVISIYRHHRDMLSDKDCENVYELVYSSHRAVAQAAGEFLNERLFSPDNEIDPDVRTKRGKKRLPATPLIRDLVEFMIESELHEHGAYLVDSLIESNSMMKDWECMTDLLLEEPGPKEEALENRQESSLIEIMVCCIRQAATGDHPVGRGPTRKILSAKEQKLLQEDKQSLTAHFIQTLPHLLRKYAPDAEKVSNLLVIPQYFDLEIYTTSRQEKNLEALLQTIKELVEKHYKKEVLEATAVTLHHLCDEQYAIFTKCSVHRSTILEMVATGYKYAIDEYMNLIAVNDEPNDDDRFHLVSSLRKVESFYSCHNMSQYNIWESMFSTTVKYKDSMIQDGGNKLLNMPTEAVKSALNACFYGLISDQNYLETASGRESTVSDVEALLDRLNRYMTCMKEILSSGTNVMLKEEAFTSVCDLLIMFQVASKNSVLSSLIYRADKEMWLLLNKFIQEHVFIHEDNSEMDQDDHAKIEELHKKRNFLAGFCKLIVYNSLPTKTASDVFRHYVAFYDEYGDIIKTTLGKVRENNKVNCAKAMVKALHTQIQEIQQLQDTLHIDTNTVEFHALKELAKRFALSFGLDALKNREAVAQLHKESILISAHLENTEDATGPPPNLSFLEIAAEFSNKLLKQDKKVILNYLDKRMSMGMPSSAREDWQPLLVYRNSLLHGEGEMPIIPSKKPYSRKKRGYEDDDENNDEGSDPDYF
ncbi:cohesin subunit SA-1 [Lepeophtheirus salmonis]|uniref:cohesin subunit SA-1 n=1 Tax=Lepeophtheirus salmonis TaxID=72036 RepID=UPI001AE335E5|nr:cohesin subunit SA-1-like [Lepeophtheirus salmonis]